VGLNRSKYVGFDIHAQLGYYFRQFLFLDEAWYYNEFDSIFPSPKSYPKHWEAAIEGFSYNGIFISEFYNILNAKDYIYYYLRQTSKNSKSTDISSLNQQLIYLATISFLTSNETLSNSESLVSKIIRDMIPHEYSAMLWLISDLQEEAQYIENSKLLVRALIDKIFENSHLLNGDHVFDFARLINLFEVTENVTAKIIQYYYSLKDNSSGFEDLFDYLIKNYNQSPEKISEHFANLILKSSSIPRWPEDKILLLTNKLSKEQNTIISRNNNEIRRKYFDSGFGGPFLK
jgi:hypothetical protein